MTKHAITKWLVWAVAAMAPAGFLIPASALTLASHLANDPGATINDSNSQTMVALLVVGGVFLLGAVVAGLMGWIGALANADPLAERTWFNALRWCGVVGIVTVPVFGLGALILGGATLAYLIGGPERSGYQQPKQAASLARTATMAKPQIVRWAAWGLVALGVGGALALLVSRSTDQGGFLHGHLWTSLALIGAAIDIAVVGGIAEAVAWWGALFNSRELANKTWFNVLLWSGIVGTALWFPFGEGALISGAGLIVYLIAAPDAAQVRPPTSARPTPPPVPPVANTRAA